MTSKKMFILAMVVIVLAASSAQAKTVYNITDLGTLGGDHSSAHSINNSVQIVGAAKNAGGDWCATLFDPTGDGNNINLGTLGGDYSEACSNNDSNQIVGFAKTASGYYRATLFDPCDPNNNIDLGTLGGDLSIAYSINDSGEIVGEAQDASAYWRATLFDPCDPNNNINLGTLGGNESWACSINDSNQIVGKAQDASGYWRAILFDHTAGGENINLGTLGGNESWAYSINNGGQIVGKAQDASGNWHATLFDPTGDGNNIDLGTLGGDSSSARSINDSGQIVGFAQNLGGDWRPALFDPSGGGDNINLNDLIIETGWTLGQGLGHICINDNGCIVGSTESWHGYLLKGTELDAYHVDVVNGNDNNNGFRPETAFVTIQKGIESAEDGLTVLVYPGVYQEAISFLGKAIMVRSAAEAAVLEAPDDFAVSFYYGEGPNSVLKNFIITNSYVGIFVSGGSPTISNVTLVRNESGMEAYGGSEPDISSSIFWNNADSDLLGCQARYSCVQESSAGEGNIDADPFFVDPNNGDYHLLSQRGRYLPAYDLWVIDEVTSPCIDAGDPTVEPSNERMPNGGRINMGAYGGTAYASMSEWWIAGDINQDSTVNMIDFAILAENWLQKAAWLP